MSKRSANHVAVAGAVCGMRADIAELLAQAGNIGIHYPLVDAGGFVAPHTAVYLYTTALSFKKVLCFRKACYFIAGEV